jgi:tetratricopeptide (TPR) repeat protein
MNAPMNASTSSLESDGEQHQAQASVAYATGQAAFERGQYRESINWLVQALEHLPNPASPLGGAIQIWLVTAYDASGEREAALDLCRELQTHSDYDTRQQSRRLLYILEAPKLQSRAEWLTQIPDLNPADNPQRENVVGQARAVSAPKPTVSKSITADPIDPIDPKESRGFLVSALSICVISLGLLWWFAG